jgi:hypothetical protein
VSPRNRSCATPSLSTLNHPDVYRLLVSERGWTPDEHEEWLADLLCNQLLSMDALRPLTAS